MTNVTPIDTEAQDKIIAALRRAYVDAFFTFVGPGSWNESDNFNLRLIDGLAENLVMRGIDNGRISSVPMPYPANQPQPAARPTDGQGSFSDEKPQAVAQEDRIQRAVQEDVKSEDDETVARGEGFAYEETESRAVDDGTIVPFMEPPEKDLPDRLKIGRRAV